MMATKELDTVQWLRQYLRAKEGGGQCEGIRNDPLCKRSVGKDPPSPRKAEDNNRIKINTRAPKGQSSESH